MSKEKDQNDQIDHSPSLLPDQQTLTTAFIDPAKATNAFMKAWEAWLTLWVYPLLMLLRPHYGTTHVHPFNQFLSLTVLNLIGIGGTALSLYKHAGGRYLIGMPIFVGIIWLVVIWHANRHRKLMLNMDLEDDSEWEGAPLRFFGALPRGDNPSIISIVYQPLLVMVVAVVGMGLHIIHPVLAIYLFAVATMLCMRAVAQWLMVWSFVRDKRNQTNRLPLLQQIIDGKTPAKGSSSAILAAMPVRASPREKAAIYAKASGLDAEFAAMLTKPEEEGD